MSRDGIIPISRSQDTAGPMARSVADAAAVLAAISGEDANDVATQASAGHVVGDYAPHLKADGLTGARIGVVRDLMGYKPDVDAAMEKAIAAMQAEGATVVDADIDTLNDWHGRSEEQTSELQSLKR